jgi:hypothetical protein
MHNTRPQTATLVPDNARLRLTACPEPGCGQPTEIYDEVELASTDGPIAHARTVCVAGHWLFLAIEQIRP